MSQPPHSRRTASLQGSSRLGLSVEKGGQGGFAPAPGRHPLKHDWSVSYVHRPPGTKVDYEKEIKRVATFGSIESFLHLYSHLIPPNELQPVTDVLVFLARIPTPGTWECMPDGGKFTIRLVHPITPLLYEALLFALIGDQFDDDDRVVGCVLSVRQTEDLISVWVEDEGESLRSGALREKIIALLGLPVSAICEYRSNRALLDAAATQTSSAPGDKPAATYSGGRAAAFEDTAAAGAGAGVAGGAGGTGGASGGAGGGGGYGRYNRGYQGQGTGGHSKDESDERDERRYSSRGRTYGYERRDGGENGVSGVQGGPGERRNGWGNVGTGRTREN